MTTQQNETLVRRFFADPVNKQQAELWRDICTSDYVHHDPQLPGVDIRGLDNYIDTMNGFFSVFPDIQVSIHHIFSSGDRAAARWTFSGTQRGAMPGLAPTGKQVSVNCISIHRMAGGKVAESWVVYDALGMMQQLGVVPSPG